MITNIVSTIITYTVLQYNGKLFEILTIVIIIIVNMAIISDIKKPFHGSPSINVLSLEVW